MCFNLADFDTFEPQGWLEDDEECYSYPMNDDDWEEWLENE